jgi:cobalt-zinc-cadmium efflux system membrane fusion protein
MSSKYLIFNIFILFAFAVACKSGGDSTLAGEKQKENLIVLDASQVKEAGIVTSTPVMDTFYETFPVTGMLVSPPAEKAFLQSPVSGWVDAIFARPGDLVNKGTPIVRLKSAEAIEWQREYAEVRAELRQARTDYQRLKSLSENEITAKKELLQAETRLQTLQARFNAARARLSLLNEDTASLNMSPSLVLRAPINGILSNLNINLNSYVAPGTQLGYIINSNWPFICCPKTWEKSEKDNVWYSTCLAQKTKACVQLSTTSLHHWNRRVEN